MSKVMPRLGLFSKSGTAPIRGWQSLAYSLSKSRVAREIIHVILDASRIMRIYILSCPKSIRKSAHKSKSREGLRFEDLFAPREEGPAWAQFLLSFDSIHLYIFFQITRIRPFLLLSSSSINVCFRLRKFSNLEINSLLTLFQRITIFLI